MHEVSIVRNLLAAIERAARREGMRRVRRVDLWLGALAHISPEHLRALFEEMARGTVAEGAKLQIEQSDELGHEEAGGILLKSIDTG